MNCVAPGEYMTVLTSFTRASFLNMISPFFSWHLLCSQEKIQAILMEIWEGQTKSIMVFLKVAYRELTQQEGWNTQYGRMTKRCRLRLGMQSRATFFRHSAVLIFPAVLLRKLRNGLQLPSRCSYQSSK